MNQETPVDALNRAISAVKTQSALAAGLTAASKARGGEEVTAARIWNWVNRDKKAPAEFCPDIEDLTGVRCEDLAPDVNWAVLRKNKKPKAAAAQVEKVA
jgi:DNA-binding transcriptional regulator YdaS (Cro superfamily)